VKNIWLFLLPGALLVGILVTVNVASEYRRLRRQNAPGPAFLLWRRLHGWFLDLVRGVRSAEPSTRESAEVLAGRTVWISWDVRWGSSGNGLGRIADIVPSENGPILDLRLTNPIALHRADASIEPLFSVQFHPSRVTSPGRYLRGAVRGSFRPPPTLSSGVVPVGSVVVYPAGAA
jgi:hypothetical protein